MDPNFKKIINFKFDFDTNQVKLELSDGKGLILYTSVSFDEFYEIMKFSENKYSNWVRGEK